MSFYPAKVFPISGLKLGKKESVFGVETQAIEYQITPRGAKEPISATVWVDVKTNLPVQRVVALKVGKDDDHTVTETYIRAVADGKLDEGEFELPKANSCCPEAEPIAAPALPGA